MPESSMNLSTLALSASSSTQDGAFGIGAMSEVSQKNSKELYLKLERELDKILFEVRHLLSQS